VGNASPTPAVFFRDSTGQIYDQSLLSLVSGNGEVIAVETYLGGTVALVRDNLGDDHLVLRYSDANVLLWTKRIEEVVPSALVCTDQIYVVGHTDAAPTQDFFNSSGRITALDAQGDSLWSTVIGGIAADTLTGAAATAGGLVAVGQQTSSLGSTLATQAGVVVFVSASGQVTKQRSYGHATDIDYRDVTRLTDDLFMAVGQIAQSPAYFVMNANGDMLNHQIFTSDHEAITSVEAVDGGSVIVSLSKANSHSLARLYTTHTVEWAYTISETASQGSLGITSKGIEWVSSFVSGGSLKGVVLRLPSTGGLSTLPYSVDCEIVPVALVTTASTTGIPVDDVGPWSDWEEVQLGSYRVGSSVPPDNQLPGTVDTATQEYKDHFWANGGTHNSGGYGSWNEQETVERYEFRTGPAYNQPYYPPPTEYFARPDQYPLQQNTGMHQYRIRPDNLICSTSLTFDQTYYYEVEATDRSSAHIAMAGKYPSFDRISVAHAVHGLRDYSSISAFIQSKATHGLIGSSTYDQVETSPGIWTLTIREVGRPCDYWLTRVTSYRSYSQTTYRYYPKALTRTRVYEPVLLSHTSTPTTVTPQSPTLQPAVPITQIYSIF
jgi:hypothetical protein